MIPPEDATGQGGARPGHERARVVLVNMPFANFRQPSLALGLLKAALEPLPVGVTVLDATLLFAALVGLDAYETIAAWQPQDLLGDRVFAPLLSQPLRTSAADYERLVLAGGLPEHAIPFFGKPPVTVALRAGLRTAEAQAGALLDACLDEIVPADPLVVGFTSMFHQQAASLALAARVKAALPHTCIVFGGAACHGLMGAELLGSFAFVDAVACGEGEGALRALVERVLAGADTGGIPGMLLADRASAQTPSANGPAPGEPVEPLTPEPAPEPPDDPAPADMDALPLPDYDDYSSASPPARSWASSYRASRSRLRAAAGGARRTAAASAARQVVPWPFATRAAPGPWPRSKS